MTNFEILTGLKSAYTKLCNSFNDPIQDDCTGCPFEVFGDACPLQEAIELVYDLGPVESVGKTSYWKDEYRKLADFVMELDSMSLEDGTTIERYDGRYYLTRTFEADNAEDLRDSVVIG